MIVVSSAMVRSPLQLQSVVFGSPEDKVVPGIVSQPYETNWVINNRLFTGG